jgi:uncharacterized membrane protein YphA (DoxX/SURF4 family)
VFEGRTGSRFLLETTWRPRALTALRIITGLLFLAHGLVKLVGFPAGAQPGHQGGASDLSPKVTPRSFTV